MVSLKTLTTILSALAATATATATTSLNTLNVTVLSAKNNHSTLECWALEPSFKQSSTAGTAGSEVLNLGLVNGNASYSILPAKFDAGGHNAPALQWVIFLSGLAHITLPKSTAEAWIPGGRGGAILALDTAAVSAEGHYTEYPSETETVALQVPVGGKVPGHRVLYGGACKGSEVKN